MALSRRSVIGGAAIFSAIAAWGVVARGPVALDEASPVLPPPQGPLRSYHLGHSLVGRDMPAMLAQMAGHDYASQLGWGTPLKAHWKGGRAINGFDVENSHAHFRPARGLERGGYDALVLTEMVDIHDAVDYYDSATYLARWVNLAREGNPDLRVFLYETWPHRENDAHWLARIEGDHGTYWRDKILRKAAAKAGPIHMIPAGQVVAAYVKAGGASADVLARNEDGTVDTIHLSDLGNYLVALTHYAVMYQRDPSGLPAALLRGDGTAAQAPSAGLAAQMQALVWDVVRAHPLTGIAP
ncbi:MAG: hypothetical protein ACSHWZ_05270 [Sulfitobacter sp.]